MKNPFVKAETKKKYLKISIYGGPGVGKTWFALGFPNPSIIDLEGGTDFYADRFNFSVLDTKSFADVLEAVNFLEIGQHQFETLIIDPITVVWSAIQDGRLEFKAKNVDKVISGAEKADFNYRDWGQMKRFYSMLMTKLVNLPMHVILVGRMKDEYEMNGSEMVKKGVKLDAEKSTPYLPDIVFRLEVEKGKRVAVFEKDRSGHFQVGSRHESLSYESFRELVEKVDGQQIVHQVEDEASRKDAEFFQQQESGKKPNDGGQSQQQKSPQTPKPQDQKPVEQQPPKGKQETVAGENGNGKGITPQILCGMVANATSRGKDKDDKANYVELWKAYVYRQYGVDSLLKLSSDQLIKEKGIIEKNGKTRPVDFRKFLMGYEKYFIQETIDTDSKNGLIKSIKAHLNNIFNSDRNRIDFYFSGLNTSIATIDDLVKLDNDNLVDIFNKVEITYNEHKEAQSYMHDQQEAGALN